MVVPESVRLVMQVVLCEFSGVHIVYHGMCRMRLWKILESRHNCVKIDWEMAFLLAWSGLFLACGILSLCQGVANYLLGPFCGRGVQWCHVPWSVVMLKSGKSCRTEFLFAFWENESGIRITCVSWWFSNDLPCFGLLKTLFPGEWNDMWGVYVILQNGLV